MGCGEPQWPRRRRLWRQLQRRLRIYRVRPQQCHQQLHQLVPASHFIHCSVRRTVRAALYVWVGFYCLTWRVSGGVSCQVPYHTLHRASSLFRDVARCRQHHSRWNASTVQRVGTCRHVRRASSVARVPVRYGDNGRAPVGLPCSRSWPRGVRVESQCAATGVTYNAIHATKSAWVDISYAEIGTTGASVRAVPPASSASAAATSASA